MIDTVREQRCFGGVQGVYTQAARSTGCPMRFALFLPPQAQQGPVPLLLFLSGLTCTEENFTVKAGAQRYAAEAGLALLVPDTSPRGLGLPGERDASDFGEGAGFWLDATREPWARHYRMESWVLDELLPAVGARFPARVDRVGVSGHSMGGHGALTWALRHPGRFASVSALAPICAPAQVPWGGKAFAGYLGEDRAAWRAHDACALLEDRGARLPLLVDQGAEDQFLATQLRPDLLSAAAERARARLDLRLRPGYDHGYFFVATFIGEHVRHHAEALRR